MGEIKAGVTVMQDFCRAGSSVFQSYIDYLDRDEAQRNNAIETYNLYHDYMGNPEKTTGLFTADLDELDAGQKKDLKHVFDVAQENGSVMWQTVISFDNRWLEQNGLYDSQRNILDERKIKEVARMAVNRMLEKEGLGNAVWSAAIHYNTDNFHVHVATAEPYPMRELMMYQGNLEIRGKFKLKNIEACKSSVVNEIMQTREMNLLINRIIRQDIVKAKESHRLAEDPDIRKKFLQLYNSLPNVAGNFQNYNNGAMNRCRPLVDEISKAYLEKYHKEEYTNFLDILKRQSDLYSQAYGRYDRSYEESKKTDLMERLGNAVLKEVKEYGKRIRGEIDREMGKRENAAMRKSESIGSPANVHLPEQQKNRKEFPAQHPKGQLPKESLGKSLETQPKPAVEHQPEAPQKHPEASGYSTNSKRVMTEDAKEVIEFDTRKGTDLALESVEKVYNKKLMEELEKYQKELKDEMPSGISGEGPQKQCSDGEQSGQKKDGQGLLRLGEIYLDKQGGAYDPEKGISYMSDLAENGNMYAQTRLGCEYMKGENVQRDTEAAKEWFTKAAEQGDDFAKEMLNHINSAPPKRTRGSSGSRARSELNKALYSLQRSMDEEHRQAYQALQIYEIEQEKELEQIEI